jgi:glycosyltransferase involved in cell wall biosynthesis
MDNNIKISVLMPVYYKESPLFFDEALKSIVNQTYLPNEIVIIKDGILPKDLDLIIEKYEKIFSNLICVYYMEKSKTLGEVLNFGVERCKNEYIARMDSDDIAPLDRLEKQVEILKQNPDLDVLGGFIEEYDESMEKIISIRKVPIEYENIKKYIKIQNPFNHRHSNIEKTSSNKCWKLSKYFIRRL